MNVRKRSALANGVAWLMGVSTTMFRFESLVQRVLKETKSEERRGQ